MSQIQLSQHIYDKVREAAARRKQTPDRFVEELLVDQLSPPHPYIELIHSSAQARPIIKGTRIGVDVIVGYFQAGNTPQAIAAEILPHVSLAQIYDALSYYEDHRLEIDALMQSNAPDQWQARLIKQLGEKSATRLLGQ